jgi:HlyD family secretion protein
MNGQVVMDIARRDNVVAVPSDAIRNARDAATVAPVLGLSADSLRKVSAAARQGRGAARAAAGGTASSTARGDTSGGSRIGGRRGAGVAASGTPSSSAQGGFNRQADAGAGTAGGAFAGGGGGSGGGMVVFVKKDEKYTPRLIRVGISDFDYTEILSGVQPGEQVALLGAAVLQAQREELQSRIRSRAGGGLQQQQTPAAGTQTTGGGGGGRAGGGGRPPGG